MAAPSPARVQQNYQEDIYDAVRTGNLHALKCCHIGASDINRRLLPLRDLEWYPKYNPTERYIHFRGPTITMLAVFCEQDEILRYILENLGPDLSIKVEGFNVVHIAAMIKDYRPLQLLLRYRWVQEFIDEPIDMMKGMTREQGDQTTALHAAVSHRRVANVMQLVSGFPDYQTSGADESFHHVEKYSPANVDRRSANGVTPFYLAVLVGSFEIVRILSAAGADPSIPSVRDDVSAIDLANKLREEALRALEAPQPVPPQRLKAKKTQKERPAAIEIADFLDKRIDENLDELTRELSPELIAIVDAEEDQAESPKGPSKREGKLDTLIDRISSMDERLKMVEASVRPGGQVLREPGDPPVVRVCKECGVPDAGQCNTCHNWYCESCGAKPAKHPCGK
jgi:hypothetical protein